MDTEFSFVISIVGFLCLLMIGGVIWASRGAPKHVARDTIDAVAGNTQESVKATLNVTEKMVSSVGNKVSKAGEDWALATQKKELRKFIGIIESLDGAELGLIVAQVIHFRNRILHEQSLDLNDPQTIIFSDPFFTATLSKSAIELQNNGNPFDAAPISVWVHSFRSVTSPELRKLGRQMWGHLERGFAHVQSVAEEPAYVALGLDLTGGPQFPKGLTPQPL